MMMVNTKQKKKFEYHKEARKQNAQWKCFCIEKCKHCPSKRNEMARIICWIWQDEFSFSKITTTMSHHSRIFIIFKKYWQSMNETLEENQKNHQ